MAKVITFGIQKGGSAKTTSAGIVSYLLSLRHKVLACDMDSQGNLTELLMQRNIYDFHGRTILEAMKQKDARPYIHPVTDTLDMLTAEDLLATFPRYLYQEYRGGNPAYVLRDTLQPVMSQYDFIVIDTPPALGDQTINALAASDGVVILYETSKFAYSALERFVETVVHCQEKLNPKLEVYGILPCLTADERIPKHCWTLQGRNMGIWYSRPSSNEKPRRAAFPFTGSQTIQRWWRPANSTLNFWIRS